ncbi:hypothetical protein COW36_07395 [bacterium (Candidatus Blackallbacteria) CG17_big_fil_post_rev_8_21_14_2_50_48_46]|uniref:Uncharacterized protein n=1 Tax=bacterium (Candidatus Blackallbacteria) CG17_big_fil_post_rev_8_21_14_2_50_48_46 TaxID=2014261 RepID=A0A2M7G6T0_9BACT|nr:MAG: hypothetical protein COW64_16495 [bacterium (Candidatus Blackallbacteria) CG18_big_fil_WC_8_21_14_2_50_49_26]PIW17760.1 MAG: hypothetical protein COW36_07395 [bacterium (Candidatus Blackallbacteria) CG17_big_fil_post_rev_8_21_14_2_50_48_46]PIW47319.1 MAG: hypothetical protein COW20_12920 [bacterium (Candidatus Blackallbacteria) CG13_big_fil_rev_8_21_14_2_50_49_14]
MNINLFNLIKKTKYVFFLLLLFCFLLACTVHFQTNFSSLDESSTLEFVSLSPRFSTSAVDDTHLYLGDRNNKLWVFPVDAFQRDVLEFEKLPKEIHSLSGEPVEIRILNQNIYVRLKTGVDKQEFISSYHKNASGKLELEMQQALPTSTLSWAAYDKTVYVLHIIDSKQYLSIFVSGKLRFVDEFPAQNCLYLSVNEQFVFFYYLDNKLELWKNNFKYSDKANFFDIFGNSPQEIIRFENGGNSNDGGKEFANDWKYNVLVDQDHIFQLGDTELSIYVKSDLNANSNYIKKSSIPLKSPLRMKLNNHSLLVSRNEDDKRVFLKVDSFEDKILWEQTIPQKDFGIDSFSLPNGFYYITPENQMKAVLLNHQKPGETEPFVVYQDEPFKRILYDDDLILLSDKQVQFYSLSPESPSPSLYLKHHFSESVDALYWSKPYLLTIKNQKKINLYKINANQLDSIKEFDTNMYIFSWDIQGDSIFFYPYLYRIISEDKLSFQNIETNEPTQEFNLTQKSNNLVLINAKEAVLLEEYETRYAVPYLIALLKNNQFIKFDKKIKSQAAIIYSNLLYNINQGFLEIYSLENYSNPKLLSRWSIENFTLRDKKEKSTNKYFSAKIQFFNQKLFVLSVDSNHYGGIYYELDISNPKFPQLVHHFWLNLNEQLLSFPYFFIPDFTKNTIRYGRIKTENRTP